MARSIALNVGIVFLMMLSLSFGSRTIAQSATDSNAEAKSKAKDSDQADFFKIKGAKDCAFDSKRQKLFVPTGSQLVVVDTKAGKIEESIDLAGTVSACDISLDQDFLAIACAEAQAFYWISLEDIGIKQVRFKAPSIESGVYDLCFGSDNSILFSTTFKGSGGVSLRRFDPESKKVKVIGGINMDAIITPGGDRKFAAIAEGNISNGPLSKFDFDKGKVVPVTGLNCFHYEIACATGAKFFASPQRNGCEIYGSDGGKLGLLKGEPVICAAFHPKTDSLFVMRHKEKSIQEYDLQSNKVINRYPLLKALEIVGDVNERIVGNIHSGGRSSYGNFNQVRTVHYSTFRSGRLKVSEDGALMFAVVPYGVYSFKTKAPDPSNGKKKRVIEVIDG